MLKSFKVPVTRDVTESTIIELHAPDRDAAIDTAIEIAMGDPNKLTWERDDCMGGEPYVADAEAVDDLGEIAEGMSEAEGIRALRAAIDLIGTAEPVTQRERDEARGRALLYVDQLAADLFDRTDVDIRTASPAPAVTAAAIGEALGGPVATEARIASEADRIAYAASEHDEFPINMASVAAEQGREMAAQAKLIVIARILRNDVDEFDNLSDQVDAALAVIEGEAR